MTIETNIPCGATGSWRLQSAVARFFRSFHAALRYRVAEDEMGGLSDRYLRDIGVERSQISEAVRAQITRTSLMDTGWALRREPSRR